MYVLLHKINASIFVEYKENGDNFPKKDTSIFGEVSFSMKGI